jgi:hypothetical protein
MEEQDDLAAVGNEVEDEPRRHKSLAPKPPRSSVVRSRRIYFMSLSIFILSCLLPPAAECTVVLSGSADVSHHG